MTTMYSILGVEETATIEEIKTAYHLQALKCHPDKNKYSSDEAFKKLTEAYKILSNATKKENYDNLLKKTAKPEQYNSRGSDLKTSMQVKIIDMIRGTKKTIITKREAFCDSCSGTGSAIKKTQKCRFCNGTGLQGLALAMGMKKRCKYCNGNKVSPLGDKCPKCKGTALIPEAMKHEIKLSPLIYEITIPGMGNSPVGKGKAGDLIVELNVEQDKFYKVNGLNITCKVSISPAQAILGDIISLNVFDKVINLCIPSGAKQGQIIEQENCGINYENKTGLFRAVINITIPDILSQKEEDLYKELLSIEKRNPSCPTILNF
jgi:molecular chaperone DnaJ